MITQTPYNIDWNFFLALEKDLDSVARYVEFVEENYKTYSIELSRLLLAAGSEFDVLAKKICKSLDKAFTGRTINQYIPKINKHFPKIYTEKVYLPRYGLSFLPLLNFQKEESPIWWKGYNHVKHNRDRHYREANLQNVLNALGGVIVINFYLASLSLLNTNSQCEADLVNHKLQPDPILYKLDNSFYPVVIGANMGILLSEKIKFIV